MQAQFTITDNKTKQSSQVDGSLFIMKNSTMILYTLVISLLVVFTILALWSCGRIKYSPDKETEKSKTVKFKEPISEVKTIPAVSKNDDTTDIEKEIEHVNSL